MRNLTIYKIGMKNTRNLIFTTILLLIFSTSKGQATEECSCISEKQTIGTQGRNEDRQSKKFIRKEYSQSKFEFYSGEVKKLNDHTFKFGEEILFVNNTCKILINIFQNGILYPEIITGPVKIGPERKKELESMLFRNDSLTISDLKELRFIKKSPKSRVFRFWLFTKGVMNPTVCFIALTNDTATRKTGLETFIKGSKLSFFKTAWIIL